MAGQRWRLTFDVGLAGGIAAWRMSLLIQVDQYAPVGAAFLAGYALLAAVALAGALGAFLRSDRRARASAMAGAGGG